LAHLGNPSSEGQKAAVLGEPEDRPERLAHGLDVTKVQEGIHAVALDLRFSGVRANRLGSGKGNAESAVATAWLVAPNC
jgi:hypothetical protein